MMPKIRVMIAGIGGASLGTELFKCLKMAGEYEIYGCDISATAYGMFLPGFKHTFLVDRNDYINSVIDACRKSGADWLLPGGEQPMILLGQAGSALANAGISFVGNASDVVALCSDKGKTFMQLKDFALPIPRTAAISSTADIREIGLPCIVKPATGSGGSASVFFAVTEDEAMIYADFIRRSGIQPIVQEYVDIHEGEFTIGVLSLPDKTIVGSIAMRRSLDAKLSVAYQGRGGIVSSGYSQGYIGEYPALCRQAEHMAKAIDSRGPLNIQGRVRNGVLLPFEINPRFSASTYLRSMAGFNEVDIFLRHLVDQRKPDSMPFIRTGWYLRSLTEQYVAEDQLP
jgi:carbamoyl-phosphate synthase large subunit